MAQFSDDFNRPDGGLGNNWSVRSGSFTIASNLAVSGQPSVATHPDAVGNDRQEFVLTYNVVAVTDYYLGVLLKYDTATSSGLVVYGAYTLTEPRWHIRTMSGGVLGTDRYTAGSATPAGTHTMRVVYEDGTVYLWVDALFITSLAVPQYAANASAGLYCLGATGKLDSFSFLGDEVTSFSVSPSPIGNYGSPVTVTFTGVGTAWTPGTPGSPTFTVNHGTLTDQTVTSATSATATYDPGTFLGIARFTDPSTGVSCEVQVTSNPAVVPPGGIADTWSPYKTLVDATGTLFTPDWLLTDRSPIIPSTEEIPGDLDIIHAIHQIWLAHYGTWTGVPPSGSGSFGELLALIAGSYTPTVSLYEAARTTSIREELEAVRDSLTEMRGDLPFTLRDVRDALGGDPFINHQDLLSAISGISGGSNQDVLDWLNLYLGTTGPTLAQLGTMISDLATIAGYDLGDVLDAIAAIPGTDLTAITNKLNLIQPSEAADLTTITNQLTTIDGNVDDLENSLAAIRTGSNYTFQDILDAIAAITPGGPGESGPALSLWPGQENVTLGTELPLSDGMTVPGPLNGLIFTITASAPRAQKFMFGTVASWARVGQVLFVTDRGDYERGQTYGIDRHIVIPTTMTEAASALILVNSNWEGTVTPWTRT